SPGLRLAALAQLARCSPDGLPGDVVPVVSGLLREMRSPPEASAPEGDEPVDPDAEQVDPEPVAAAETCRG
ncbi:hypothetical protein G3I43_02250, partial [Streptomyces anulatus]